MPGLFEGRPDEQALWAAIWVSTELLVIKGLNRNDTALVRAIACDSTYRQAISGKDEKSFTSFPETQERVPQVYETLARLGYKAIAAEEKL